MKPKKAKKRTQPILPETLSTHALQMRRTRSKSRSRASKARSSITLESNSRGSNNLQPNVECASLSDHTDRDYINLHSIVQSTQQDQHDLHTFRMWDLCSMGYTPSEAMSVLSDIHDSEPLEQAADSIELGSRSNNDCFMWLASFTSVSLVYIVLWCLWQSVVVVFLK